MRCKSTVLLSAMALVSSAAPAFAATVVVGVAPRRVDFRGARSGPPHHMGRIGFATAACLVLAGLALGILYSPSAPPSDLTALLQPAPLQLLTD